MKTLVRTLAMALGTLICARSGYAQEAMPPPSPPPPRIQPNGDWERHSFAPHVITALNVGVPLGSLEKGDRAKLGDNAGTFKNFELGVGLRVRRIVVDLLFSIGGAGIDGAMKQLIADEGFDPSGVMRVFVGGDLAYYLKRTESWAPWVGTRIGYESLAFNGDQADELDIDYTFNGWYAAARTGVDWRMSPWFGVGPFFEAGLGRFSKAELRVSRRDIPSTIEDESDDITESLDIEPAFHGYVGGGFRLVIFP